MGLSDPRASVLECGCGRSPPPLSNAGRTFIQRTHVLTRSKAANPLRSIAALQNVAGFLCIDHEIHYFFNQNLLVVVRPR
jgi:hypothetical protein